MGARLRSNEGMVDRCPVCDAESTPRLQIPNPFLETIDPLDVNECTSCRLLHVSNEVTVADLDVVYGRGDDAEWNSYYETTDFEARAKAERAVVDLRALLAPTDLPVVDVGFGFGHFLEEFARGGPPEVIGQEFSTVPLARAEARGIRVVKELDELEPGSCSAAVMLDVAEHVIDANQTFREINRVLAPGGIVYVHTPRRCMWDSLAAWLCRRGIRRVPLVWLKTRVSIAHLRLWSDDALQTSLERSGFVVESYKRELELSWPVRRYIHIYLTHRVPSAPLGRLLELVLASLVAVPLRLGLLRNKAIVVARKRE